MVFVVSFSSCLDVAAISMDMGQALDTNNELMTVGISNCEYFSIWHNMATLDHMTKLSHYAISCCCAVVSGLAGGFTGSYIFSQTIFTYRTGMCVYVVVSSYTIVPICTYFELADLTQPLPLL